MNQVIAFLVTISCSREIVLIHRVQSYYETLIQVAHLRQESHNSKLVVFQEKLLNVLNCYTFSMSATTQLLCSGEFLRHYTC